MGWGLGTITKCRFSTAGSSGGGTMMSYGAEGAALVVSVLYKISTGGGGMHALFLITKTGGGGIKDGPIFKSSTGTSIV